MPKIEVLIADDHPMVRSGLRNLLESSKEFVVVSEADNGEDALAKIETTRPHIAILDIDMPKLSGIDAAARIVQVFPRTKVVILTMHEDEAYMAKVIEIGAHGYLLKDADGNEIIRALKRVAGGERYFAGAVSKIMARAAKRQKGADESLGTLTAREKQIIILISEGLSTPEIAKKLFLSPRTVESHRSNIMHKLNIHQATALVRFAIEKGLIKA